MNDSRQTKLIRLLGFLNSDPDNYPLLCEAGDLALELGDLAIARPLLEKALELNPADLSVMYRMAVLLFIEKNFEESLQLTQAILNLGEQHPSVLHRHALSLVQLGRFEEAAPIFARLTTELETFPDVPHQYIRALHYTGDLEQATAFARAHLDANADDAVTKGMLSLLYIDQEDFKQAEKFATETLAVEPNNMDALLAGGAAAIAFENHQSAKPLFEQATKISPLSGRAWMGLGVTSMLDNDLASARKHFETTVKVIPEHLGSWITLAWIHIMNRDLDAAQATLEHANEIDHNFGETHGGLAVVAVMRGEWEKAKTLTDVALRLQPESFSGRFAQSLLIAHRGRPEQAAKLIDGVLDNFTVPGGGSLHDMIKRFAAKQQPIPSNRTLH